MRYKKIVALVHDDIGVLLRLGNTPDVKAFRWIQAAFQKAILCHRPLLIVKLPSVLALVQLCSVLIIHSWVANDVDAPSRILHVLDKTIRSDLPNLISAGVVPIEFTVMHLEIFCSIFHVEAFTWI